jgi:hypothetical protein
LKSYPEMMKIREQVIQYKKHQDEEHLNSLMKSKQITPRTFNQKRRDIEVWVEKEKDEVKRIQQVLEE